MGSYESGGGSRVLESTVGWYFSSVNRRELHYVTDTFNSKLSILAPTDYTTTISTRKFSLNMKYFGMTDIDDIVKLVSLSPKRMRIHTCHDSHLLHQDPTRLRRSRCNQNSRPKQHARPTK